MEYPSRRTASVDRSHQQNDQPQQSRKRGIVKKDGKRSANDHTFLSNQPHNGTRGHNIVDTDRISRGAAHSLQSNNPEGIAANLSMFQFGE